MAPAHRPDETGPERSDATEPREGKDEREPATSRVEVDETPRYRLPRGELLRSRQGFRSAYDNGKSVRGQLMVLITHPVPGARRVGFVASRKVGGAVARNRARRLLREAYRYLRVELNETARAMHIVLIARRPLVDAHRDDALAEMRRLFELSGVIDGAHREPPS